MRFILVSLLFASQAFAAPIELEPGSAVKINCVKYPAKRVRVMCATPEPTATPMATATATPTPRPTLTATPTPTPVELPALGVYVQRFDEWGRVHCEALKNGPPDDPKLAATYYDAAWVYFQGFDKFHDPYWLGCAQAALAVYRDYYVLPNNGNVPGYWNFPHGVAEDCVRNATPASCNGVRLLATNAAFARDTTAEDTRDPQYSREVAYAIHAMLQAERIGEPRRARLSRLVNDALSHIDAWFVARSAPYVRPFMTGLTAHALIAYNERTPDPRIVPALRIVADSLFPPLWLPQEGSFSYTDRPTSSGGLEPAPDLNQLITPLYFYLANKTGVQSYRDAGAQIFAGGVAGAWLNNGKQFNQSYRWGLSLLQ